MSIEKLIEKTLKEDAGADVIALIKNKLSKAGVKATLSQAEKNGGIMSLFVCGDPSDRITIRVWVAKEGKDIMGGNFEYDSFYHTITKSFDTEKEIVDFATKHIDLVARSILNVSEFRELKEIFGKIR